MILRAKPGIRRSYACTPGWSSLPAGHNERFEEHDGEKNTGDAINVMNYDSPLFFFAPPAARPAARRHKRGARGGDPSHKRGQSGGGAMPPLGWDISLFHSEITSGLPSELLGVPERSWEKSLGCSMAAPGTAQM